MIRTELAKWQEATNGLIAALSSGGERDIIIERVVSLLADREELKYAIQAPFTPEEEVLGRDLVLRETELTSLMKELNSLIKGDILRTQKTKTNMHSYTDPYSAVVPDGTYYDQRK